jgi:hypothetical protein
MFLTANELKDLTGYKRPSDQRRWLAEHGWAFEIRADGKNRVLAEEARHKMLSATNRRSAQRSAELDLASLRALT